MPELPDLELYTSNLKKFCNDRVDNVLILKDKKLNVSKGEIVAALEGSILEDVTREGKEVWFKFSSGSILSIHLMLKGRFDHLETEEDVEYTKYKIVSLEFEKNRYLVISDQLSWATLTLNPLQPNVPDALSMDFNLNYLREKLSRKKNQLVKTFLLDQSIVRGIGNAYADEILWDCKISPSSRCGRLPNEAIEGLYNSIKRVLENAVQELIKSTPSAINGEYRDFLSVHNASRKFAPSGYEIKVEQIASKTSYYTDEQILYE